MEKDYSGVSTTELVRPSIFDTDEIKNLKLLLAEVLERVIDHSEEMKLKTLEEIKKEEMEST
jgi:hypothetical protein